MRVQLNVTLRKLFSLVSVDITGNLNITTGGGYIDNLVKKKIIKGLRNNNMRGYVTIDGKTIRV